MPAVKVGGAAAMMWIGTLAPSAAGGDWVVGACTAGAAEVVGTPEGCGSAGLEALRGETKGGDGGLARAVLGENVEPAVTAPPDAVLGESTAVGSVVDAGP